MCKRSNLHIRHIQAARMPEHSSYVNYWLWPRPPPDPSLQSEPQPAPPPPVPPPQAVSVQRIKHLVYRPFAGSLAEFAAFKARRDRTCIRTAARSGGSSETRAASSSGSLRFEALAAKCGQTRSDPSGSRCHEINATAVDGQTRRANSSIPRSAAAASGARRQRERKLERSRKHKS